MESTASFLCTQGNECELKSCNPIKYNSQSNNLKGGNKDGKT
jgi:hypothetical protein